MIEQWQVACRSRSSGDEDWIVWDTYDESLEAFAIAESLKKQGNEVMVSRMLVKKVYTQ